MAKKPTAKEMVALAVGFLLFGILSPIAIGEIYDANTTGWESSVVTIFQILAPILYIVGAVMYYV